MNPGRELDILIAEKVMGITLPEMPVPYSGAGRHSIYEMMDEADAIMAATPLPYSTDISAAWKVVEKIKEMVKGMDGTFKIQWYENYWEVYWDHEDFLGYIVMNGSALTAPHAICLAALKAINELS